ncbi:MAG: histidine kinase dimerization/phospho-acceptor domain-containing protein [Syntrophomonadaceae bacterium]|nr:histidine kinase dimerization/phospho-acceptor domain-containing protein [Syntrophomonadaceae bacterium]
MKKSIRLRLFIGIAGLIVFFVLFSWLLNTQYLGKYYRSQKTEFLIEAASDIKHIYDGNPEDIYLQLENLERNSGINTLILDKSLKIKYSSKRDFFANPRPDPHLNMVIKRFADLQEEGNIIDTSWDPRLNTRFLNLVLLFDNQDILVLSTPLAAIQANAEVANTFFLYTGFLTILIGSILAFVLARQFTRPILELNNIAQEIARLDFSKKYDVKSNDEIGELGDSINSLSAQLDKTIMELQNANQKLRIDIEQERRIDEMRKEFISNVSHELKTPISLIQGYAEGLKVNVIEDETNKNLYCDVIIDESGKMNQLVKDLLDLSQIESGHFKVEKSIYNIAYQINRIISKFDPLFKERGINPIVRMDDDTLVNADIIRSEQVLTNYLTNALNHIDENKLLRITLTKIGQKVRISVLNSGKHIPEEALDRIFTSFYKVDKARTRAYGGSGLGLSVVRAIQGYDNNGFGVINADEGVEFWFELDLADDEDLLE